MRLHKTGHEIADRVSDLIGEVPEGDYEIAYGILRHSRFKSRPYFEIDKGFWGASHYDGNYRLSFNGTQPRWMEHGPMAPHGLEVEPWKRNSGPILICPPSSHVCGFFGVDLASWLTSAIRKCDRSYIIRPKNTDAPLSLENISTVITFNSTVGVEALRRGIPVISDPIHSTIGSYCGDNYIDYDREPLLRFMKAHQFKLGDREAVWELIKFYLSS